MGNAPRFGGITEQDAASAHTTMTNENEKQFDVSQLMDSHEWAEAYRSIYGYEPSRAELLEFVSSDSFIRLIKIYELQERSLEFELEEEHPPLDPVQRFELVKAFGLEPTLDELEQAAEWEISQSIPKD